MPRLAGAGPSGRGLEHWLENIARPDVRHRSYEAYRTAVRRHLVPGVGEHRLDRLEPEHLERLYRRMVETGAKPATAHQVHRTARTALGEAVRRSHVVQNVAALAKPPRVEPEEVEPYSLDEVQLILAAAQYVGRTAPGGRSRSRLVCARVRCWVCGGPMSTLVAGLLRIRESRLRPLY